MQFFILILQIPDDVKREIYTDVNDASFTLVPSSTPTDAQIFKVHFTHALDLVKNRKVFLRGGFAYVPFPDLAGVIAAKFRSYISESLSVSSAYRNN